MSGRLPDIGISDGIPARARMLSGAKGVEDAVRLIRDGEIVGVPTETVYGLAGNALNPKAIVRIFEAKGRPLSDPLIVHLAGAEDLPKVAQLGHGTHHDIVQKLAMAFWPGPMTILIRKNPDILDLVTAGSAEVAVRVPSHPLFREVIAGVGAPVAAPSANRFGRISPTSAKDVLLELGMSIPAVLDGGLCGHGVESTILRVLPEGLQILRPGPISEDQLIQFGHILPSGDSRDTPGSLPGHYAPETGLSILDKDISSVFPEAGTALLAFRTPPSDLINRYVDMRVLSPFGDLREAALNLYSHLRSLDHSGAVRIVAEPLPETGIGIAIMDRLRRASYGSKHQSRHHS